MLWDYLIREKRLNKIKNLFMLNTQNKLYMSVTSTNTFQYTHCVNLIFNKGNGKFFAVVN